MKYANYMALRATRIYFYVGFGYIHNTLLYLNDFVHTRKIIPL